MRDLPVSRLKAALVWATAWIAVVVVGPRQAVAQTDPAEGEVAAADTLLVPEEEMAAWRPAPTDTVWTAVITTVPSLGEAQASYDQLATDGAMVFARVRATFVRYRYEIVLGPWPDAAALDSVLAADQAAYDALSRPPAAARWESARRGTVAEPRQVEPPPDPQPEAKAADGNAGG